MKRFILNLVLGFFFLGALIPGNNVGELSKIPNLVRHFLEHQAASDGQVGFLDFLSLHYGMGSDAANHRSHSHKKENLPLVSSNFNVHYFISHYFKVETPILNFDQGNKRKFFFNYFYNFQFKPSFFNPPR